MTASPLGSINGGSTTTHSFYEKMSSACYKMIAIVSTVFNDQNFQRIKKEITNAVKTFNQNYLPQTEEDFIKAFAGTALAVAFTVALYFFGWIALAVFAGLLTIDLLEFAWDPYNAIPMNKPDPVNRELHQFT